MIALSDIDKALVILGLVNLGAFCLFWFDKVQAREHGPRIPERYLLLVSLAGGMGAWIGQHTLRHKTRKEPFRTLLGIVVVAHLVAVATAFYILLR